MRGARNVLVGLLGGAALAGVFALYEAGGALAVGASYAAVYIVLAVIGAAANPNEANGPNGPTEPHGPPPDGFEDIVDFTDDEIDRVLRAGDAAVERTVTAIRRERASTPAPPDPLD